MNNLRKLRKQKGLTLVELAELIRINKSSIASYETGISTMDANVIKLFSDFYKVSAVYLIGKEEDSIKSTSTTDIDNTIFNHLGIVSDEQKKEIESFIEYVKYKNK